MQLRKMLQQKSGWLTGGGEFSDLVISSRVRLARNLKKIPFPGRATPQQQKEVFSQIETAVQKTNWLKNSTILRLSKISLTDRRFLMERHLISYEHATREGEGGLVIGDKEIVSIMINEEDHLRIQVLQPGFSLDSAQKIANRIDDELNRSLNYAFSEKIGYLTACPTNTGTGLRCSCLMHLPALVLTKEIDKVLAGLAKLGAVARGFYGEGTKAIGNLFQISNQVSLGRSEETLLDNIQRVVNQVIRYETKQRQYVFRQSETTIEDLIYRAYGVLSNTRSISFGEAMDLLSHLKLGLSLGKSGNGLKINSQLLNELMLLIQPAHLQEMEGRELLAPERDRLRAKFIRERIK